MTASKHEFWLKQFEAALPVFIAERFTVVHRNFIMETVQKAGVDSILQFVEGSYAKENWSSSLAYRMETTLGEFITTTQWWKDQLPYIRKTCGSYSKVKKVMES